MRSPDHLVAAVTRHARQAAGTREIVIVAENEKQDTRHLRLDRADGAIDAIWNDDFHHSAVVAMTGRREAYYSDHHGSPQEFISAAKRGYLFQGQRYTWQKKPRGTRTDGMPPTAFVNFIENHDQIANSGDGSRLHQRVSPGRYRACTALLLLLPSTPLLFQGQEFGASSPVPVFRGSRGRTGRRRLRRAGDLHLAVSQPWDQGSAGVSAGAARSHDLRTLQAAMGGMGHEPGASPSARRFACAEAQ